MRGGASVTERLYHSAIAGDVVTLERTLAEPGADINATWYGGNLLVAAIMHNRPEVAEYLIWNGVDCNFRAVLYIRDEPYNDSDDGRVRRENILTNPPAGHQSGGKHHNPLPPHVVEPPRRTLAIAASCRRLAIEREMWGVVSAIDWRAKQNVGRGQRNGGAAAADEDYTRMVGGGTGNDELRGMRKRARFDGSVAEAVREERDTAGSRSGSSASRASDSDERERCDSIATWAAAAFVPATAKASAASESQKRPLLPDIHFRFLSTRCALPTPTWSAASLARMTTRFRPLLADDTRTGARNLCDVLRRSLPSDGGAATHTGREWSRGPAPIYRHVSSKTFIAKRSQSNHHAVRDQ